MPAATSDFPPPPGTLRCAGCCATHACLASLAPGCPQELYLDQNSPAFQLPPDLSLLPALRKMYVASTPAQQEALQQQQAAAQAALRGSAGGRAAAQVAANLIRQSTPFS